MKTLLRNTVRALVIAGASLSLVNAAEAQWRGGHGYHHHHRGGGWGGAPWVFGGLGLGLGIGLASAYSWPSYGYAAPTYVYTPPPTVVYRQPVPPATVYTTPIQNQPVYPAPVPAAATVAPVIYPRNGQTDAQREADADACSQWAGQQPNATSDRSVFTRGITACMDARGYTLR